MKAPVARASNELGACLCAHPQCATEPTYECNVSFGSTADVRWLRLSTRKAFMLLVKVMVSSKTSSERPLVA